jgi:isoquinoline 1-oxidoreductase subunit beta
VPDERVRTSRQEDHDDRRAVALVQRQRAALELAAEKSGWGTTLTAGRGRGIAVLEAFGSILAQVTEVSVDQQGAVNAV